MIFCFVFQFYQSKILFTNDSKPHFYFVNCSVNSVTNHPITQFFLFQETRLFLTWDVTENLKIAPSLIECILIPEEPVIHQGDRVWVPWFRSVLVKPLRKSTLTLQSKDGVSVRGDERDLASPGEGNAEIDVTMASADCGMLQSTGYRELQVIVFISFSSVSLRATPLAVHVG